ncbi:MAG: hypothetical protein DDT31_01334 [Syntrophomonadaceae bacterium]|nr:hypothetical protein [Bacillota bacterium]
MSSIIILQAPGALTALSPTEIIAVRSKGLAKVSSCLEVTPAVREPMLNASIGEAQAGLSSSKSCKTPAGKLMSDLIEKAIFVKVLKLIAGKSLVAIRPVVKALARVSLTAKVPSPLI